MANTWIPVKYDLPKENVYCIVWMHPADNLKDDENMKDLFGDTLSMGYSIMAYFNKKQGGIWELEAGSEAYGSDLNKVDTEHEYYISHWMPMPDGPEE